MAKDTSNKTGWMFDPQSFGDMSKLLAQFNVPGVDISAIVEAQRQDLEALVDANKAAYEAMQALARKQADVMTQTMQGIQEAARSAAGGGMSDPLKQAELARAACQKALSDMKEMAEIARAAQMDAATRISQRAAAGMQAIWEMMRPK